MNNLSWILWYSCVPLTHENQLAYLANMITIVPVTPCLLGFFNVPCHATHYMMALVKFLRPIEAPTVSCIEKFAKWLRPFAIPLYEGYIASIHETLK